ncbi:uncharacterized protein LOC135370547 [Ornithodoros turicata]|uniref:uncharacterized protein LOC135370546 n=1 Tax=Ornithodoros turicata TaxID=34597 RepID=UPI0031387E47
MRDSGDVQSFVLYFRMTPDVFDYLHDLVKDDLTKQHVVREPLSSYERLALTFRYLSSGMAFKDVAMAYRVGIETAREAVHLTCTALWNRLKDLYMMPPSESEWQDTAQGFGERWNFPNCLGAVDGKHVRIVAPNKSGSTYFNYKGTYSIVLMAVVDSHYKFVLIDVGAEGRQSDCEVLKSSAIGRRHCVKNAFGILASRWRILLTTINLSVLNAENVIKAVCILHNFLAEQCGVPSGLADEVDTLGNVIEGGWHRDAGQFVEQQRLQCGHTRSHSCQE